MPVIKQSAIREESEALITTIAAQMRCEPFSKIPEGGCGGAAALLWNRAVEAARARFRAEFQVEAVSNDPNEPSGVFPAELPEPDPEWARRRVAELGMQCVTMANCDAFTASIDPQSPLKRPSAALGYGLAAGILTLGGVGVWLALRKG